MRKLGRMVRRVLTAVSLLLFVAVLGAWVRGYWRWDGCRAQRESMDESGYHSTEWTVEWGGGEVGVVRYNVYGDADQARAAGKTPGVRWDRGLMHGPPQRVGPEYARLSADFNFLGGTTWVWDHSGVVLGRIEKRRWNFLGMRDFYSDWHFLAFPCWMAALVFGALPSWRFVAWWRGRRLRLLAAREGRCGGCGYDLRASPLRCPECGLEVEERHEGT